MISIWRGFCNFAGGITATFAAVYDGGFGLFGPSTKKFICALLVGFWSRHYIILMSVECLSFFKVLIIDEH